MALVGYPASGKSVEAEKFRKLGYTVISSDDATREIQARYGLNNWRETCETKQAEIDAEIDRRFHEAVNAGKDIVFDVLNITVKRRSRNLEVVKASAEYQYHCIALVVYPPEEDLHAERLVQRVFFEHRGMRASNSLFQDKLEQSYQPPTYDEGYHEIHYAGLPPKQPLMRM